MKTITAQTLYDARDENGLIDGRDLHDLFRILCDGEPSPAGATPISRAALAAAWDNGNRSDRAFIDAVLAS